MVWPAQPWRAGRPWWTQHSHDDPAWWAAVNEVAALTGEQGEVDSWRLLYGAADIHGRPTTPQPVNVMPPRTRASYRGTDATLTTKSPKPPPKKPRRRSSPHPPIMVKR